MIDLVLIQGLMDWEWWGLVLFTLVMTHITIISVTVYLHRCQAHRALDMHPALAHFFRAWLWLTTGMETHEWVAVHRYHHARCETPEDPHSPQVLGIRKVLWQGAELYGDATHNKPVVKRYRHGTPDDWLSRHVYSLNYLGVTLMLLIDVLLFGIPGIVVWAVQMLWIPFFAAGVINGLGHYWGYRNFDSPDASTNLIPWGILIGGEEMHNNHHAHPSSAKLSAQWWEFDIGWFYIRLFEWVGLTKVRRVAQRPVIQQDHTAIDMNTVKAVVQHRMHVLANYAREVIQPVIRTELYRSERQCRGIVNQARRLLASDRLDAVGRQRLNTILEKSQALATVHQYRCRLRDIWERSASNQEVLLKSLQRWCKDAEETGIEVLQDFARSLRNYRPAPGLS